MKMRKLVALVMAALMLCSIIPFTAVAADSSATIDFTDKANRTAYSTEQQVWEQNGIVVTNDKGASTSNVGDYGGEGYPARFYKSSTVKIEYPGMTQIVIDCTGLEAKYVDGWTNSFSADATATKDGSIITIVLAQPADSFVWEQMTAQSRAYNITVYSGSDAPVVPPVTPDEPEIPDTPVTPDQPTGSQGVVANPVAGVAYKFGMVQENVSTSDVYYLIGGMSSYYMASGKDVANAIDVYLEETDGGYYLYALIGGAKTYINMVVSGTHVNGAYEDTASTVYTYNADYQTVVAIVNDAEYWFGTRNDKTYTTVGPCAVSYAGFYCKFYSAEGGDAPVVPPVTPDEPETPDTPDTPVVPGDTAVLDFTTLDNRVSVSTSMQVWKQNGIIFTNDKGASTSNVNEKYFNPVRCYKSSTVTIEYPGMTKIVIDSVTYDDNDYAIGWTDSFSADATATVVDGDVTIVLADPTDVFVWEKLSAQSRAYTITVYTGDAGDAPVVPPVEPDEPEQPDTPAIPDGTELTIADAIAMGQTYAHNTFSENKYYVTGVITEIYNDMYGNMKLADEAGNILTIYGTWSEDGSTRFDAMSVKPVVGDTVVLYGIIGQYNGTSQMKNGWIIGIIGGDIPDTPDEPEIPDVPVEPGDDIDTTVPYLLGMVQENVSAEDVYFINGLMNGYYMDTTTDAEAAILVYLEKTNGGYYLYALDENDNKVYINMVVSGTHVNGAYESAPSTVYAYDYDLWTLVSEVNGELYAFGTRNDKTYTTMGPVKVSYNGFHADLYYFEDDEPCEHEYDDEYDADCNICGELREVPEEPVYVGSIATGTNSGAIGEMVSIGVQLDGNPGIVSVKVKVHFDNTVLKLVEATPGEFSASGYSWGDIAAANEKGYFIVNWCDATRPNSMAQMLATLTFEILETAQVGEMYEIYPEFNCQADIFNAADETVWFYAVTGSVVVNEKAPVVEGDIDGNGKINNRDLGVLQKYLNGSDVTLDEVAADMDGNGKINNRDLGLLQKLLNA